MGLASAESGSNYDKINNPDGTVTVTLLPYDRINIDGQWQNYNFFQDATTLSFESGSAGFKLDKITCDFKLYEKDRIIKAPIIENYKMEFFKDATKVNSLCVVSIPVQDTKGVSFTTTHNEVIRTFDLNVNGVEWTTRYANNDGKDILFTIKETIPVQPDRIEGDKLYYGDYLLDLKNEQHNSLKSITNDKGDLIIEYEQIVTNKEILVIDPTFSSNDPTEDGYVTDSNDNGACATVFSRTSGGSVIRVGMESAGSITDCYRGYAEWDTSPIPVGSDVTDVVFIYDVFSINGSPEACDITPITNRPSTSSDAVLFADIGDGTRYVTASATCQTTGDNKSLDLGTSAETDLENLLPSGWFAIGIRGTSETQSAGDEFTSLVAEEGTGTPDPTLQVTYTSSISEAVDDLVALDVRSIAVDLDWTTPSTASTITGYQINYTTPWSSSVNNIVSGANDTESIDTAYTVSNLVGSTKYSFRVGVWTIGGINASGNVINITTDFDPTASFTPGTFNLTGTGTDVREIKYLRTDIDDTTLTLDITADNDFELACNFHYKFANTNNTYTNIANVSINANEDMATFQFNNVNNEIIDVLCWDQYTNASAKYVITITDFPLLQQIADFKAGEFGTLGMFGALDFISLIVVIFAMVGFNRVNETVGVVLGLFIVGGLAVLSNGLIISWATTFTAGFAVVIMWAIATTRKD